MDDIQRLIDAAGSGDIDVVKELLEKGVDPSAEDDEAIRVAAENGHTEVVRRLLDDNRVDPAAMDNYAIRVAAANNHPKVLELFLKLDDDRVDPGAANNIAIGNAADNGFLEVVQLLLDDDRVNASQFENNFAIREAANEGHTKVVQLLLNWKGANGERVDPRVDDNDAICKSAQRGHTEVVRLLLGWKGNNGERVNPAADENFAIIVANAVLKKLLAAAYVQLNICLSNNEYFLYNERDSTFTFLYRQVDLPPEFASTAIEFNRVIELSKGIQAGYQEFLEKKELKIYPTNQYTNRTAEERQQQIEEYKNNFMIVNEYSRPILLKNRASQHLRDRGRTVENRHWDPNSKNARNIVWTYFYMEKYNTLHGKNPFYNAENWSFQMAKELFLDTAKIPPADEEWNRIITLKFKF